MPTTLLDRETLDQAKVRRFREEADYFSIATNLSRSQAAGLLALSCGDGTCGASDCSRCRPNCASAEPIDAATIEQVTAEIMADKARAAEAMNEGWSDEFGDEPASYTQLIQRLILAKDPIEAEFYRMALKTRVTVDCRAAARRALKVTA